MIPAPFFILRGRDFSVRAKHEFFEWPGSQSRWTPFSGSLLVICGALELARYLLRNLN